MLLTEQFINGLNDNGTVDEILKEIFILEDIKDATREQVVDKSIHGGSAKGIKIIPP